MIQTFHRRITLEIAETRIQIKRLNIFYKNTGHCKNQALTKGVEGTKKDKSE